MINKFADRKAISRQCVNNDCLDSNWLGSKRPKLGEYFVTPVSCLQPTIAPKNSDDGCVRLPSRLFTRPQNGIPPTKSCFTALTRRLVPRITSPLLSLVWITNHKKDPTPQQAPKTTRRSNNVCHVGLLMSCPRHTNGRNITWITVGMTTTRLPGWN